MSLTHSQVKAIVDALPGVSAVESLFVRAVALHETSYGTGWRTPEGKRSNNMGAITTRHPDALSFEYKDSLFDAKLGRIREYVTWFAGWPTPEAGLAALAKRVLTPSVRAALAFHDFLGAVSADYDSGYFMGLHQHDGAQGDVADIEDYWRALVKSVTRIGQETGEVVPDVLHATVHDGDTEPSPPPEPEAA